MEQIKALNALEVRPTFPDVFVHHINADPNPRKLNGHIVQPFLALSKSATHPKAAADLITQATSAPNTYVFAELLQRPQIQALAENAQFASHLRLLQIFSYDTYQSYCDESPSLPDLNDAQTLKLRQLSLLTLARDRANLSYNALQKELRLPSARELEDLVITVIYAGLVNATLDPARQAVQVTSTAPLRDLSPGSIPEMIEALNNWSHRCTSTLGDLEAQIQNIRTTAAARENEKKVADRKLQHLVGESREFERTKELPGRDALPRRGFNKRSMVDAANFGNDEIMEVDEPLAADEQKKRASKRKM
ncbi:hypothetical protein QQS21_003228 [Conoideocrella luteorostrata]|uniref:PCI domain-containing protein n=1 Tax=Conoideocrella luteorostrata TaxID=1105319 RepID=A0AAJ0G0T0_9HYPO|nr:hypothetical protein QQS21_003228 [Conoideocrella luteorostrata]